MCAGSVRRSGVLSELGRGGAFCLGALRAGSQVLCAALGSCSVRRPVRWLWPVRGNWERWARACCALRGSDAMCGGAGALRPVRGPAGSSCGAPWGLGLAFSEASVAAGKFLKSGFKLGSAEVGPEDVGDDEFGVTELPEQEV